MISAGPFPFVITDNQPGLAAPAAGCCPPKAPNPAAARKCHTTTMELIRSEASGAKK